VEDEAKSKGDLTRELAELRQRVAALAELEAEHAQTEESLRRSEERYRTVAEFTYDWEYWISPDGTFIYVSPSCERITGHPATEFVSDPGLLERITHPEDRATVSRHAREELDTGEVGPIDFRIITRSGEVRWINHVCQTVYGEDGNWLGRRASNREITERVRAENALRDHMERLDGIVEERTQELRDAQDQLVREEKLAITGRLAASLAHEIGNPLQSAIGCIGLAEETLPEGAEAVRFLRVGRQELRRAADILERLRDLQRRSDPEEEELIDVNELLERVLTLSTKLCEERHVEVEWIPAPRLPDLCLVPDRIEQVFLNLVLNAVDAMPEGGQLRVSTVQTREDGETRVSFTDSGVGISPEVVPHIFDPFYTTKSKGLGLGLYISQSIVEEHGGCIDVDTAVGEGTTFIVRLPA
jgi:PAS domain S-box-containing protein